MLEQVVVCDALLKGFFGVMLLLLPGATAKVMGLPSAGQGFWPRVLAAALLGIAIAAYVGGPLHARQGLGAGGLVAINITASLVLLGLLLSGRGPAAGRGTTLVWLLAGLLFALGLTELALV